MVALVADSSGEKVGAAKLVFVAVSVGCSDSDSLGALGKAVVSGVGKTALLPLPYA